MIWRLIVIVAAALHLGTGEVEPTSPRGGVSDDSYRAIERFQQVRKLSGSQGFTPVRISGTGGQGALGIDARRAVFIVANSRSPNPTAAQGCATGSLPVNPYPLLIDGLGHGVLAGGLFAGRVPQAADWRASYCNSAALTVRNGSGMTVDGLRIANVWDAVRPGRGAGDLRLVNSWISNARDDAVENDHLQSLQIRDTLIDGAFMAISMKPPKGTLRAAVPNEEVVLSGVLIRLSEFLYRGDPRFGAPFKVSPSAPRIVITDSIIAVDSAKGSTFPAYWSAGWSSVTRSQDNLLLWMADAPVPAALGRPPAGFEILAGRAARTAWERARTNWINCHPKLERLPTDPSSRPRACQARSVGGPAFGTLP